MTDPTTLISAPARAGPTPATRERVAALARQAAAIIREELGADTRVVWFGSWVQGRATARSDLDIAIDGPAAADPLRLGRIRERLDALPTLYAFDLVALHEAGDLLRRHVARDGMEL